MFKTGAAGRLSLLYGNQDSAKADRIAKIAYSIIIPVPDLFVKSFWEG